jgi:hypothetical protein
MVLFSFMFMLNDDAGIYKPTILNAHTAITTMPSKLEITSIFLVFCFDQNTMRIKISIQSEVLKSLLWKNRLKCKLLMSELMPKVIFLPNDEFYLFLQRFFLLEFKKLDKANTK